MHGKAGLITKPDGSTSSFIGSINETAQGWDESYELIWEDTSPEAAKWVREEFDWLWNQGVSLSNAVIDEIGRTAQKVEVQISELKSDAIDLAKSCVVESPLARRGDQLAPWQKAFIKIFVEHFEKYGSARLLLADEVGVGKTLSMATSGILGVLLGHGPVLILCPPSLSLQWQTEILEKLGVPSFVWGRNPSKGWIDNNGILIRSNSPAEDILRCPGQIGIISTGILVHRTEEAESLLNGKLMGRNFGTIILDEGHKARCQGSLNSQDRKPNNLYSAMEVLANRTRHLIIGTATPIQTDRNEIWDLLKLLALGNEHVLGRKKFFRVVEL